MSDTDVLIRENVDTTTKVVMKPPSMFNVILHNDEKTSMEFVILVLMSIFQKSLEDATALMFNIHETGKGIAGTYTNEIATQKRSDTIAYAKANNFPLRCEIEET